MIGRPTARNHGFHRLFMKHIKCVGFADFPTGVSLRQEAAALEVVEVATAAKRRARVREVPEARVQLPWGATVFLGLTTGIHRSVSGF